MIERAIDAALASIRAELREHRELIDAHELVLDAATVIVEACEKGRSQSEDMMTLKADIVGLRCDVDKLKSVDLSMLFSIVDLPEVPSMELPAISEIPPASMIAKAVMTDEDVESDAP
ncbi:uncharacterized protein LOC125819808 [Solanum verrucosum]|uniref:uncharacterized protein LOC125819808 n=1 Tax=Solanum verrucosum TaxID=315347 RepID=UPI0020D0C9A2|nr:uncharacterized protein LOC125819808 [Solanum verrucosum]